LASPQSENGHIDIANEIAEALMLVNLSPYEVRIAWCILRKTYGWHKKEDRISLSQFQKDTNLKKPHICRTLSKLVMRNMIVTRIGNNKGIYYSFQKDYEKWKPLPKKVTLPKQVIDVTQTGNKSLPKQGHTKDNKDTKQKTLTKDNVIFSLPDWIDQKVWDEFLEMCKTKKHIPTKYAKNLIVKKLDRLRHSGQDPGEVLNQSIENGWKGVFELRGGTYGINRKSLGAQPAPSDYESPEEYDKRMLSR